MRRGAPRRRRGNKITEIKIKVNNCVEIYDPFEMANDQIVNNVTWRLWSVSNERV